MDPKAEIRDFLVSRRARLAPEQSGLPVFGSNRRVKGLRREEVAMLAGISAEYYVRIERGNLRGVSQDVLDGIARALQLHEAERSHLNDLARSVNATGPTTRRPKQERVPPGVQRILDSLIGAPAFVLNARADLLGANQLGQALFSDVFADIDRPVNMARFAFLNPKAPEFFIEWDNVANDVIGVLRAEAGRDPYDKRLSDLIGELSTRSQEFRGRWAAHDVKLHRTGTKRFHHPLVGDLTLAYESLQLTGDPGQQIVVYTAEPASPSQQALDLLASWTSTPSPSSQADRQLREQ
jgi:transcriptional regulator with XRE-family HTH domain